jgi:hypothetical protein
MESRHLIAASLAGFCLTVYGGIYTGPSGGGWDIPDGNPAGVSDSEVISGLSPSLHGVSVKLNVTGGFNGDLYAYLSCNGVLVPLLNRVGVTATSSGSSFGHGDAGLNITLSSSGANDLHFYGRNTPTLVDGQLTGTWQPDGRAIDPLSSPGSFDSASRVNFDSYNNLNPNGTWTLFFADLSAGGSQSHLVSWELDITTVPEPVNVALGCFAGGSLVVRICRSERMRKLFRPT